MNYLSRIRDAVSAGSHPELSARVSRLEAELDEYRRDSLRVAEILDILEERLTPNIDLNIERE